jgi:hypothetical protein
VLTTDLADAVVGLARQLVAFDSVNPGLVPDAAGEGPIARFLADWAVGHPWRAAQARTADSRAWEHPREFS